MSDFAKDDRCFSIPDRTIDKPSIVGNTKDLPSQRPVLDTEMENEDEAVKTKRSGAATVDDNGHALKNPLFMLNPKEKIAAAEKAAAYLSREKVGFVINKPVTDDDLDPRAKGSGRPSLWVSQELAEIDGVLAYVDQEPAQVRDTSCKEPKKVPSRLEDWSDEVFLESMMDCDNSMV